ncbi:MAG: TonB-dependent receptor [Bacteroidales bacterium]|nr:TonB-dependent receptor [Bacteroidales bacterium]
MKRSTRQNKTDLYFLIRKRERYAIFNTLERKIKICLLPLVYPILIYSSSLFAQQDTVYIPHELYVEEVEIIGQRSAGVYSDIARAVTVITKDYMEHAPVQTINDIFEFMPGVDLRQRGNLDVQADIGIRGGSFEQTLILVNGIPFNDPQTGHHNLNLPFDFSTIEKIEILKGPGSRVYGANAFSGAVNIITKTGNQKETDISLTAGQNSYLKTSLSAGHSYKKLAYYIGFSGSSCAGYTNNTDFQNFNAYYKGDYLSPFGKFGLQAGFVNKAFGASGFYTPKYPDQFEQINNRFLAFTYSVGKPVRAKLYFSWRRHQDRFELFREERYHFADGYFINGTDTAIIAPGVYYSGHNYHLTNSLYGGVNIVIPGKTGKTSLGLEYHMDHILSSSLGTSLDSSVTVPGEDRGIYTKGAKRELYSIFFEQTKDFGRFYFAGGALLNISHDYGYHACVGLETGKRIKDYSRLFLSVNPSFRLPTFTDLYYNGPVNMGNPDLNPEKAVTVEGGYRFSARWLRIEASVFDRMGYQIIDWVKLPEEDIYTTKNYNRLITYGFDISTGLNAGLLPSIGNWLKYVYLSYGYVNTEKYRGKYISAYALDYLKHKLTARISHQVYHSVGLSWNLTFQDRNGTYTDQNGVEHDYKPFLLVNARLYWKPGITEIYMETSNLLNVKYRDLGSIVQPGIWFYAGLNIHLSTADLK